MSVIRFNGHSLLYHYTKTELACYDEPTTWCLFFKFFLASITKQKSGGHDLAVKDTEPELTYKSTR